MEGHGRRCHVSAPCNGVRSVPRAEGDGTAPPRGGGHRAWPRGGGAAASVPVPSACPGCPRLRREPGASGSSADPPCGHAGAPRQDQARRATATPASEPRKATASFWARLRTAAAVPAVGLSSVNSRTRDVFRVSAHRNWAA